MSGQPRSECKRFKSYDPKRKRNYRQNLAILIQILAKKWPKNEFKRVISDQYLLNSLFKYNKKLVLMI